MYRNTGNYSKKTWSQNSMLNSTKFYGESLRKREQIGIASIIIISTTNIWGDEISFIKAHVVVRYLAEYKIRMRWRQRNKNVSKQNNESDLKKMARYIQRTLHPFWERWNIWLKMGKIQTNRDWMWIKTHYHLLSTWRKQTNTLSQDQKTITPGLASLEVV